MEDIHLTVNPDHAGERLDKFLSLLLKDFSRARLQKLIDDGFVTLNGKSPSPSQKIKVNDEVRVQIPPPLDAEPQAQSIPLDIIYEDQDLLVLNKPAGLVVHPGVGNPDRTLVNALLAHCGDSLSGIGGVKRPGIVHRLDKETSGLMVVAKNDKAHHGLSEQFSNRTLSRTYVALLWGVPNPLKGTIQGAIGRDPRNRQKMAIVKSGGREATTHYETLETFSGKASLVKCKLETGRTHQIRVHMTSKGHGLLGDATYGHAPKGMPQDLIKEITTLTQGKKRQCLHAFAITFIHPATQQVMSFECPWPQDFKDAYGVLKNLK